MAKESSPQTAAPSGSSNKPNSMRKIFLLVAVAIVIFMAFTAYSVRKDIQGRMHLAAIKDMYFPMLQRLDANIVRLDKIQELYIQVVITGDRDTIEKAAELGVQADKAFAEASALYPGHEATLEQLRTDLRQYQELATKTSLAFLNQDRAAAAPMAAKMNRALADVEARLKAFREEGYNGFVGTLAETQRDAQVRLLMGLAIGVMNLGFMAVLVFFIRNNLKMVSIIAVQNATLEQRVAERTAQLTQKTNDINAMLQNMKLGVSTVIPGNRIHPEYSSYLHTIFSVDNLAGADLIESLFNKSSLGVDVKDQIAVALGAILAEDAVMFELNGHLLPTEIQIIESDGRRKTVQMDWNPIINEQGIVEKVLLITQDVTHLRELEVASAQQQDELRMISKIIKLSIGRFNAFVQSTNDLLAGNRRVLEQTVSPNDEAISTLFRNMHTIKGNARTYEFNHITDAAHSAEHTYDQLRSDKTTWDAARMYTELSAVEAALARKVTVNDDTLGRKGRGSDMLTTRGVFVSNEQLAELRSAVRCVVGSNPVGEPASLQALTSALGLVPLPRLVSGAIDSLSSLAKELNKPAPELEIINGDFSFNGAFAEAFKSSCMHLHRNSLDHGIEDPAQRIAADKPARGKIRFACELRGDQLSLHISDDGRGLALHTLYKKGIANGLFKGGEAPTRAAVAETIFHSGTSTSQQVTLVSGRGVGMDAVRSFLAEQGATIRIELSDPAGTELDFAPFEFVIDVPAAARHH